MNGNREINGTILQNVWMGELWYLHNFQQYFSYIAKVSFTDGGNRSVRRKPTTCRKSLIDVLHNIVSSTPQLSGIVQNGSKQ